MYRLRRCHTGDTTAALLGLSLWREDQKDRAAVTSLRLGIECDSVLSHYRENPDDEYLLRVGYGGMMGALSNIDQEGFASAAFHSFPSTLKWDPYTGDYGPNFFGHAFNVATYLINHPEFGWQSFGGNVSVKGEWINVQPRDSFRRRIYIATLGLWLTLDAGTFERVAVNTRSNVVRLTLSPANAFTPNARLRVQQPAKLPRVETYAPRRKFVNERDSFTIELSHKKAQKSQKEKTLNAWYRNNVTFVPFCG